MGIRIAGFGIAMGVIPFLIGMLYTGDKMDDKNIEGDESVLKSWCSGFVICFALFEVLAVPCTFLKLSLTILTALYLSGLFVLVIVSLIIRRGYFVRVLKSLPKAWKKNSWILVVAAAVILFQMFMYVRYTHIDEDDSFYVATATTAVQTDSIFHVDPYTGRIYKSFPARYVLSPFPIFVAVLSKCFGIHATMLAHTVLPLVLLPLAYAVFALTGWELFHGNRRKISYFLLAAAVISMYSFSTTHTQGTVMLHRIWQGKAVLASILLPFAFYMGMHLFRGKWNKNDWIMMLHLMLACCMVSSMGIMLGAILAGIYGMMLIVGQKQVRKAGWLMLCCLPNLLLAGIYLFVL